MIPRALFRLPRRSRDAIAADVDAELAFHLDARTRDLVAAGLSETEARDRALREFGDVDRTRAYCRAQDVHDERRTRLRELLGEWLQDARFAARALRRSPGFATIAILVVALAIGANVAIFSVTRAVLLAPLPYGAPDRLVAIDEHRFDDPSAHIPLSVPNVADYAARQRTLSGLAARSDVSLTWRPGDGAPEVLDGLAVSPNAFDVLRASPLHGRTFGAAEASGPDAPVAVASYAFFRRALGGDPARVGMRLVLDGKAYEIVGVMPRGFTIAGREALWVPLDVRDELARPAITRKQHYLQVFARLRDGVTRERAEQDLRAIGRDLAARYPDANAGRVPRLTPLRDAMVGDLRHVLLLLQATAAAVLLIACANLANVTLSRGLGRQREITLRAALGAGRGRLVRYLIAESLLVGLAGGAAGMVVALLATRAVLALNPDALPSQFAVRGDALVALFGGVVSVGASLLFGLVPALGAARSDLHGALRAGGRGAVGARGAGSVRRTLVVAQVALAVTLLVGAGLLARSMRALLRVQSGYDATHVLTADLRVTDARYDSAGAVNAFYDAVLDAVGHAPGVLAAGAAISLPTQGRISSGLVVEGAPVDPEHPNDVLYTIVRGGYFRVLRIPLVAGRFFDARDDANTIVVNRAAARRYFAGVDPIGRRVRLGPNAEAPWSTIVGVVGDVRAESVGAEPSPTVYVDHRHQTWRRSMAIVVRTTGDPTVAGAFVREAVHRADPGIAVRDVASLDDVVQESLAPRRFAFALAACAAGVALLLAAAGIYGVLAYAVRARTREFGVRLALGGTARGVVLLVLREGLGWSLAGLALGVAGAALGARFLAGSLYGVSAVDPLTYLLVALGLGAVAGVACVVPAATAMRADPLTILRGE